MSELHSHLNPHPECEILDDERVMCVACRGVYPSRRSLTGHIGRNEKCREIIGLPPLREETRTGRNYLDQLQSVPADKLPSLTSAVSDGLSPICPYCDRFISHYKVNKAPRPSAASQGNIRRHINQCGSSTKRPKSAKTPTEGASPSSNGNSNKKRRPSSASHSAGKQPRLEQTPGETTPIMARSHESSLSGESDADVSMHSASAVPFDTFSLGSSSSF